MTDEAQTPTEPTAEAPDTGEPTTPDLAAELAKWKAHARKHEDRAKANEAAAKRLAEIEEAQKTAEQKAADKAAEMERRAADAELKALRLEVAFAKGIPPESREFLTAGTAEELEAQADRLLALMYRAEEPSGEKLEPSFRPKESLKSGSVPANNKPPQLTRDDLKKMSHTAILAAKEAGQLNDLLGIV